MTVGQLLAQDGEPRFATALGPSDAPQGWRDEKERGGVLLDVASGETLKASARR